MAVTTEYSLQFLLECVRKEHDLEDDVLKVALMDTTYTFDAATHKVWDATAWAASTAYSLGDLRKPTTENGYIYKCTSAGTSGTTEPTWPTTIDTTVVDSGATWTCWSENVSESEITPGNGYIANGATMTTIAAAIDTVTNKVDITADNVTWTAAAGAIATTGAAIIHNSSHASNTIVMCIDFGADYATADGKLFQLNFSADLANIYTG